MSDSENGYYNFNTIRKVICTYCKKEQSDSLIGPTNIVHIKETKICLECIVKALDQVLKRPVKIEDSIIRIEALEKKK